VVIREGLGERETAAGLRQGGARRGYGRFDYPRPAAKFEAETIRAVLGIPKRVELSAGQLANLKAHAAVNAFKPVLPASSISDATL
jgi:hypothetical protein